MDFSGKQARAPGRDGMYETGLYEYNREDMTVEEMERRMSEWSDGDLFAIFRDELGGTHAQYSRISDFSDVALTQLVRNRPGFEDIVIDKETILYLVSILMISRMHGYSFDNFIEMRDHRNKQLFDFYGLCDWIGCNEHLFMTDAEVAAEIDDESLEDLQAEYDAMRATG
jgi:hypothetical protein